MNNLSLKYIVLINYKEEFEVINTDTYNIVSAWMRKDTALQVARDLNKYDGR